MYKRHTPITLFTDELSLSELHQNVFRHLKHDPRWHRRHDTRSIVIGPNALHDQLLSLSRAMQHQHEIFRHSRWDRNQIFRWERDHSPRVITVKLDVGLSCHVRVKRRTRVRDRDYITTPAFVVAPPVVRYPGASYLHAARLAHDDWVENPHQGHLYAQRGRRIRINIIKIDWQGLGAYRMRMYGKHALHPLTMTWLESWQMVPQGFEHCIPSQNWNSRRHPGSASPRVLQQN